MIQSEEISLKIDSINYFVKLPKRDLAILTPFFEAFEGMLTLRTPSPRNDEFAILQMLVSPYFINEFEALLKSRGLKWITG